MGIELRNVVFALPFFFTVYLKPILVRKCQKDGWSLFGIAPRVRSLCLVTPSSDSERQQTSKHMWEDDTKAKEKLP